MCIRDRHHNLFGSDDCRGLAVGMVRDALGLAGWGLTDLEESMVSEGFVSLSRVDCTLMLDCGRAEDVENVLRHLQVHGTMAYRGRATWKQGTVYFGLASRRSTLKFYS